MNLDAELLALAGDAILYAVNDDDKDMSSWIVVHHCIMISSAFLTSGSFFDEIALFGDGLDLSERINQLMTDVVSVITEDGIS